MRTVFVDVDTQIDFLYPAGALYVPGAERLVANIAALNQFAASTGFRLISSTDAHAENDPEFLRWPAHCVKDTVGQLKPAATLLLQRAVLPIRGQSDLPVEAPQVIVEKQVLDVFSNPNLSPLLDAWQPERYVVYGVVTEICVKYAIEGLLRRGGHIEIVADAVRSLSDADGNAALEQFASQGIKSVTTAQVLG